jgi:predicted nucleic acid-binding protein
MSTEVVVDSSVVAAIVTPELYSDWSSKRLSEYDYFHALDLNFYEVANAIKHKESDRFGAKDAVAAFTQAILGASSRPGGRLEHTHKRLGQKAKS